MVITCPKCGNKHAIHDDYYRFYIDQRITINCLECESALPEVGDKPRQDRGDNPTDSTQHQE